MSFFQNAFLMPNTYFRKTITTLESQYRRQRFQHIQPAGSLKWIDKSRTKPPKINLQHDDCFLYGFLYDKNAESGGRNKIWVDSIAYIPSIIKGAWRYSVKAEKAVHMASNGTIPCSHKKRACSVCSLQAGWTSSENLSLSLSDCFHPYILLKSSAIFM